MFRISGTITMKSKDDILEVALPIVTGIYIITFFSLKVKGYFFSYYLLLYSWKISGQIRHLVLPVQELLRE